MGGFVLYLANTGTMTSGPGFQVAIGDGLAAVFGKIEEWTAPVPEPILGLALLALAAVFVVGTLRHRHSPTADPAPAAHVPAVNHDPAMTHEAGCHHDASLTAETNVKEPLP